MKKMKKTRKNLLLLVFCLFIFYGCTSTFCTSKDNEAMKDYKLNILISGNEKFQENLYNFVKSMVNP